MDQTDGSCSTKNRCQAEEIIQPSDITSCLVNKPKAILFHVSGNIP